MATLPVLAGGMKSVVVLLLVANVLLDARASAARRAAVPALRMLNRMVAGRLCLSNWECLGNWEQERDRWIDRRINDLKGWSRSSSYCLGLQLLVVACVTFDVRATMLRPNYLCLLFHPNSACCWLEVLLSLIFFLGLPFPWELVHAATHQRATGANPKSCRNLTPLRDQFHWTELVWLT